MTDPRDPRDHDLPERNSQEHRAHERLANELLPEYLLGTLSDEQAERVEAALAASPALRREAEKLQSTLFALPEALEPEQLPDDSWTRLQAAVRRERSGPQDVGSKPGRHIPLLAPVHRFRALGAALALCLVLLGAVGVWGWQGTQTAQQLADEQRIIAYWMRNPDLRILSLAGVGPGLAQPDGARAAIPPGVVCILPDGRAMLLQPYAAPRGSRYVLTGLASGERVQLGSTEQRFLLFDAAGLDGVELALDGRLDQVVARVAF